LGIRDPGSGKPITDPGIKKAADPGSAILMILYRVPVPISGTAFNVLKEKVGTGIFWTKS
jgi:hypothetical protein